MTYTIKAYLVRVHQTPRLITTSERQQRPAAFAQAKHLARKHQPHCHPTFGFVVVYVLADGRCIGGFKSWSDGALREVAA